MKTLASLTLRQVLAGCAGAIALGVAAEARADPCEAPLPAPGASFSGRVTYVGDGDSLCVGGAGGGDTWIEVRLADFYAPELSEPGGEAAKAALKGLALNRPISCQAQGRSYDRVVAYCTVGGRSVRDLLRAAGVKEGGRGWRR